MADSFARSLLPDDDASFHLAIGGPTVTGGPEPPQLTLAQAQAQLPDPDAEARAIGRFLADHRNVLQAPRQAAQPPLSPTAAEPDYGYGFRYNSSEPKGLGYLGTLERPDKTGVMGEYSIGDEQGREIPSMVPTLTHDEIQSILTSQEGQPPSEAIRQKAIDFANQRRAAGLPVFARTGEQQESLYPDLPRDHPAAHPQPPAMVPSHTPGLIQTPLQPPQQPVQPRLAPSHGPQAQALPQPPEATRAWQHAETIGPPHAGAHNVPRTFGEMMSVEGPMARLQAAADFIQSLVPHEEPPSRETFMHPVPDQARTAFPPSTPALRGPSARDYLNRLPVAAGDAPLPIGKGAEALATIIAPRFPKLASGLVAPSGQPIEEALAGRGRSGLVTPWGTPTEEGHLLYAPATRVELPTHDALLISSRAPWAVKSPLAPPGVPLITDWQVVKQEAPQLIPKLAERLGQSPILTAAEAAQPPEQVVETFINRVKDNLLWLWDQTPEAIREHAKDWYVGAHARSLEDAPYLRVTPDQSSAAIAALSPQTEWFANAELARRLGYTWRELTDYNPKFTGDVFGAYRDIVYATAAKDLNAMTAAKRAAAIQEIEAQLRQERRLFVGKSFTALPVEGKARMIRAVSQALHPRSYPMILPDGSMGGSVLNENGLATSRLGWTPWGFVQNAVSALEDENPATLSRLMGRGHKVRSFFNNINYPWHAPSVTIDTHAVAAAHLSPFTQNSPEVNYAMGGVEHASSGILGANAVYAEAYKRAAAARGVLPREMQSVTWEAGRGLFPRTMKNDRDFTDHIKLLWELHRAGKLSLDQTRDAIHTAAGGITEPAWAAQVTRPPGR